MSVDAVVAVAADDILLLAAMAVAVAIAGAVRFFLLIMLSLL